ncbi:hypothetical protein [Massilia antarctica]|uniref:hypothetical protein n=1 Tax=Massilia antarctica TaxID=2765360 RepID=UPI0035EC45A6
MKKALSAIALAVATLAAGSASATDYVGTIYTGAQDIQINTGDKLYSPNHRYMFTMEYDGRLVTYRLSDYKIVYQSTLQPIQGSPYALLKRNISFAIYSNASFGYYTQVWSNGTEKQGVVDGATTLTLKNDGMLQLAGAPRPGSPYPDTIYWVSPRDNYL